MRASQVGVFVLSCFVISVGCGEPAPTVVAPAGSTAASPSPAETAPAKMARAVSAPETFARLSPELRFGFGAASWVPADASYFASFHGLGDLYHDIADSRAVRKLLSLPTVAMGLAQLQRELELDQIERARRAMPMLDAALDVAEDAVSHEIFVWAGPELSDALDAVLHVYREAFLAGMQAEMRGGYGGQSRAVSRIVEAVIDRSDDLRMPPVLLGFRLSSPESARRLLDEAIGGMARGAPVPIRQVSLDGTGYHTLTLDASMLPGWERELDYECRRAGVRADLVDRLRAFGRSQKLVVSVGVRDDYLVLSLGSSNEHLERLGPDRSLAASAAFAGLRKRFKPGLLSLYFAGHPLRFGKFDADQIVQTIRTALPAAPVAETAPGLAEDIERDVRAFIADVNADLPEPTPLVSGSFLNRGIESFSFGMSSGLGDSSEPLKIVSRVGHAPFGIAAARTRPMAAHYDRASHWVGVAFGYFERLAVPQFSERQREDFEQFRDVFVPALLDLDGIARDLLIPAIDGGEQLMSLLASGELREIPGLTGELPESMRLPVPAMVLELNDAEKLVEGCARARRTINTLIERVAAQEDVEHYAQIPAPAAREVAGGTMYSYELPPEVPSWLLPNALVTDDWVALSLVEQHSVDMISRTMKAPPGVVDLNAPSAAVAWFDLARMNKTVQSASQSLLEYFAVEGDIPGREAYMVSTHLDAALEMLGAVRSFSSRTFRDGGVEVRHSWLHVEDL